MYDTHASYCVFEEASGGGKGFSEYDATFATGTSGCSFIGNLFQGCVGPFLSLSSPQGVMISGNYGEANTAHFIDLQQGTIEGVTYVGNYVQTHSSNIGNANFYEVRLGTCHGFFGNGNYTDGRLYDFTSGDASYATIGGGDHAVLSLYRGTPGPTLVLSGGTALPGVTFPATQAASASVNCLDDYDETGWTPTISNSVNCSSVVVSSSECTKIGRQVTLSMVGTLTVTAGTTLLSFDFTLPYAQGTAICPAIGVAHLANNSCGFVQDTTGANTTSFTVIIPANQVLATGSKAWNASITYNAAT